MRNSNSQNMVAADASADVIGSAIDASQVLAASAQVVTTGTATGTLKFQFSNDIPSQCSGSSSGKLVPQNWVDIAGQSVSVASAGAVGIPKFDCTYQWLRTVWTHTNAQAGTITVNVNTKGF